MSAVILAQVAVGGEAIGGVAEETLEALLDGNEDQVTEAGLVEAGSRRAANPTMSTREVGLLGEADALIRELLG
jgi:uncharacterized membrane-anchored protein